MCHGVEGIRAISWIRITRNAVVQESTNVTHNNCQEIRRIGRVKGPAHTIQADKNRIFILAIAPGSVCEIHKLDMVLPQPDARIDEFVLISEMFVPPGSAPSVCHGTTITTVEKRRVVGVCHSPTRTAEPTGRAVDSVTDPGAGRDGRDSSPLQTFTILNSGKLYQVH